MRYKLLLLVAILFIYASSCSDDEPSEPFDHAAQALKDNDSLVKYMQEHFVDIDGELQAIENGEPAIYNHSSLTELTVPYIRNEEEINYKLYYYIHEQGVNDKPARIDRANVSYKGMNTDGDVFDQNAYGGWFNLFTGVIPGWSYGIPNFNAGIATDNGDGTYTYTEPGEGILFIPSGLAYANVGSGSIFANTPIIFYITLNDVFHTDHDEDTVLSMHEDIDGDDGDGVADGKYNNDDTDADGIPNYADADDDGDGTLTKDEDANGDNDPRNDDINDNGIPDYLDPDVS